MKYRGFILQPTYRIEGGRPVVHLYGRLAGGETFLIRDNRETPHFFVREQDRDFARELGAKPLSPTTYRGLRDDAAMLRVEVATPPDTPALRDRLHRAGIATFEADIRFAVRYLIHHGLRGGVEIEGESRPLQGFDHVFKNPRLHPCSWSYQPSILSLDIETDPKIERLLSIALFGCGTAEVLLFTPAGYDCPPEATPFATEKALLQAFCRRVRELDPDILTGWNVVDFDLKVLANLAQKFGMSLPIGRGPSPGLRLRPQRSRGAGLQATVPGRLVLDGIQLLRGSFIPMQEHSLDFVARKVLGEGKAKLEAQQEDGNKGLEILRNFKRHRSRFVEYNLTDARLVIEILEKLGLVDLAVQRSLLTGMSLDRVSGSIASFDFLYLMELHRRGRVAPTVGGVDAVAPAASGGGHVLEPEPGIYERVLVMDFQSLYPSLIRTFQIDPLGLIKNPTTPDQAIVAPNGAGFRRGQGILPKLLDDLFPRREEAKRNGDGVTSQAIKILMNSFYGVMGTSACRFHDPALANAVTSFGREILLWSKGHIESLGYRVIYGDTDSLFVLSAAEDDEQAWSRGREIVATLNRELTAHIEKTWQVDSRLELELEKLYLRLVLPPMRGSTLGARKRYVGLVDNDGQGEVVFTGMEAVRRDWTELAHAVQRELYERLFSDRGVDEFLSKTVQDLRAGQHDPQLVYRKALRKSLGAYTSTSPPHVVAARKMKTKPGRLIRYVLTTTGPEPAAERASPFDYEHYVEKQIRPIAEPVLALLGLTFEKVIGDDRQLDLF
ncbi:MAG: DNA polymerase II [Deltaproteobacteria bacterium]|nr:DNA polymerase II [Deltaproteobacteria bacterium]